MQRPIKLSNLFQEAPKLLQVLCQASLSASSQNQPRQSLRSPLNRKAKATKEALEDKVAKETKVAKEAREAMETKEAKEESKRLESLKVHLLPVVRSPTLHSTKLRDSLLIQFGSEVRIQLRPIMSRLKV